MQDKMVIARRVLVALIAGFVTYRLGAFLVAKGLSKLDSRDYTVIVPFMLLAFLLFALCIKAIFYPTPLSDRRKELAKTIEEFNNNKWMRINRWIMIMVFGLITLRIALYVVFSISDSATPMGQTVVIAAFGAFTAWMSYSNWRSLHKTKSDSA